MPKILRSFLIALHFLTRLPLPVGEISLGEVGRASWAFPAAGMVIGLLLTGAESVLSHLFAPEVRAALLLALWIALTGALHLDGLMDCCDALLSVRSPEERLEILRDPHTGAFGVAGAITLLLVKYASLASCLSDGGRSALFLAPALGRWAMVYAIVCYPSARTGGMGRSIKETASRHSLVGATALLLPLFLAYPVEALASFAFILTFTVLFARWVMQRIPGFTGDVYGALCELTETMVVLLTGAWKVR